MTPKRENDASSSFHPEPFPSISSGVLHRVPATVPKASGWQVALYVPHWVGTAWRSDRKKKKKSFLMSKQQQNEAAQSGYSITGLGLLKKAHLKWLLVTRFGQRRSGIIWLMTVEFPYLITNRICAPLELCAEESDEWQGRTQRPKWGRQRSEWDSCLPFYHICLLQVWDTFDFPLCAW